MENHKSFKLIKTKKKNKKKNENIKGIVTYPTDTIRRLLQVQGADGMKQFSGVMECITLTYKEGGLLRFYSGITAKLVRVIPDAAILFLTYESLKNAIAHQQTK